MAAPAEGGYYSVLAAPGLRVVAVNGVYYEYNNALATIHRAPRTGEVAICDEATIGGAQGRGALQMVWLGEQLRNATLNGERVRRVRGRSRAVEGWSYWFHS